MKKLVIMNYNVMAFTKKIFNTGDDVASEEWNSRGWNTHHGIRYNLIMLCKELVKEM